jgi:tRNA-2-methylthio-N6-dimethylallyladenosine synthase
MNRKYTAAEYAEKISRIRGKMPGCGITTDVLVGFPGETEEDFNETVKLVAALQFDDAYVFKYSPRKGTKAAQMPDDVSEADKKKRVNCILDLQKKISENINAKLTGKTLEVLAYRAGGELRAMTDSNKRVYVKEGEVKEGGLAMVEITEARAGALTGKVV